MNYSKAEARKEINQIAKNNGFIMREQKQYINGQKSYKFECRETGRVLISNMVFWNAYDNAQHPETWL